MECILPSGFAFEHFVDAFSGQAWDAILSSLVVGLVPNLFALFVGFGLRWHRRHSGKIKWLSIAFILTIPILFLLGLGSLWHSARLLDGRHFWLFSACLWLLAHVYDVSTGLTVLDIEILGFSLGASPWYRLCHVTPTTIDAMDDFSISIKPITVLRELVPQWCYIPRLVTLPVSIFSLTDEAILLMVRHSSIVLVLITAITNDEMKVAKRLGQNKVITLNSQ